MISNMSNLTSYEVADPVRPWGKIHDFLVEFPTGKSRYFSVDAHVGYGVKEIWAPMETVARVDPEHRVVTVQVEIDKEMVKHLARLETPGRDSDELKLHRLYHTTPDWVAVRRQNGGSLRKQSRLVRGSDLIGYEAMTQNGSRGRVKDLLFDDINLSLKMVRLQWGDSGMGATVDLDAAQNCRLATQAHALYIEVP